MFNVQAYKTEEWNEEPVEVLDIKTATQAERTAYKMYQEGKYRAITITHIGQEVTSAWNPAEGHAVKAVNWVDHFDNGGTPPQ